jgi:flagellar secretion chaperone FliS
MQYQANAGQYLTTEVFTAPPQKLQLMLIEMAIRLVARGKQQFRDKQYAEACITLVNAQQIADQLIAGVNREASPELADRVLAVYDFLARRLREANTERDEKKLDDVAQILEIERATWQGVCDQLAGTTTNDHAEFVPSRAEAHTPAPVFGQIENRSSAGISLEA